MDEISTSIPTKQWAQVFQGINRPPEYKRIPVQLPQEDEILVNIKYAGVCHSDLSLCKGQWPVGLSEGTVGGHEGAGVVVAVGAKIGNVQVGDHVGVKLIGNSCNNCDFCSSGDDEYCENPSLLGCNMNGTFQQYCICKAANIIKVPKDAPLDSIAPIMCAGVTVYNALKQTSAKPGQVIAIAGAGGGLGSLACQYARACGFRVLAISTGLERRKACLEQFNVDYFVDYRTTTDLVSEVRSITNGGPHAVIVTSSSPSSLQLACQYVRPRGEVIMVGLPPGAQVQADVFSTVLRMVTIKGSYFGSEMDVREALDIFLQGKIHVPCRQLRLLDLPKAYELMENGGLVGRIVLKIPGLISMRTNQVPSPFHIRQPSFQPAQWDIGTHLAHRFEELGVGDFFAVPGNFNLKLLDRFMTNPSLRMVTCSNELNAGYAADGYARLSQTHIAVVVVTYMVGSLSLINAIAGAYSENLKLIVISGGLKSTDYGTDKLIHHSIGKRDKDQPSRMFSEVTCASVRLQNSLGCTEIIDSVLSQCLQESLPVYIEVPDNLVQLPQPPPRPLLLSPSPTTHPVALTDAIGSIIECYLHARAPVLIHVLQGLQGFLSPMDILLADTGDSWFNAASIKLPEGADFQIQMLYSSLGWGLPATLGAQLARPSGRAVLLVGDGGFQMTSQELSTMIRLKLNPVIVVMNNRGYQFEAALHKGTYNEIPNWDYAGFASTLSSNCHLGQANPYAIKQPVGALESPIFSRKIRTHNELSYVLHQAKAEPWKLFFLECCIAPDDISPSLQKFGSLIRAEYTDDNGRPSPSTVTSEASGSESMRGSSPDTQLDSSTEEISASHLISNNDIPGSSGLFQPNSAYGYHGQEEKHMVIWTWSAKRGWDAPRTMPHGPLPLMPTASCLNYATQCFEGMKAYRGYDGKLRLFRPYENCLRLLRSASRVQLPMFEPDKLLQLIESLLIKDCPSCLPKGRGASSIYIRPVYIATDPRIGPHTPAEALLSIVTTKIPPVEDPSADNARSARSSALKLLANSKNTCRAWPGGVGDVKAGANYGPSLQEQQRAMDKGYAQTLWLFGKDHRVTETGGSNFFIIWDNDEGQRELVTAPVQDGLVLPGITRNSILRLCTQRLGGSNKSEAKSVLAVERNFTMLDILFAFHQGRLIEAFVTGTAVSSYLEDCPSNSPPNSLRPV
ncbi:hypothetical protein ANOM_002460 [Aspergillus nomiae NRRL 13137]|uniref:Pyruvate decarboxylase n=1 Tax=Aspergillus nomiae NRRL (strain ATCC 15546 / NRRL 13137 / CBS 260.88 / M93) TaxID=1509407 RepID=A0A0L1JAS0_ASPN3|nr:uncharacterized protein ANOM_002460 [Aspergillus nomiae NRRL 13137]KNG88805.1 hypothetical protein ANOM_002460 [Aspergillus nomiae NRRL 13137]